MSSAIIVASDLSGNPYALPIMPPFPMLGGKLFSCHLGGSAWRRPVGYDYSGNGRTMQTREAVVDDYWYEGKTTNMPIEGFKPDDVVAVTGKMTFLTAGYIDIGASSNNLMSSASGAPNTTAVSLNYAPTSSSRIMAYNVGTAGNQSANLTLPSDVWNRFTIFGSIHTATTVEALCIQSDGTILRSGAVASAYPAAGASPIYYYKASSGTTPGSVLGAATAIYADALTVEELALCRETIKTYLGSHAPV